MKVRIYLIANLSIRSSIQLLTIAHDTASTSGSLKIWLGNWKMFQNLVSQKNEKLALKVRAFRECVAKTGLDVERWRERLGDPHTKSSLRHWLLSLQSFSRAESSTAWELPKASRSRSRVRAYVTGSIRWRMTARHTIKIPWHTIRTHKQAMRSILAQTHLNWLKLNVIIALN